MKTTVKSDVTRGGVFPVTLVGELITFSSMRYAWHSIYKHSFQYSGGETPDPDKPGNESPGNMPPVDPSHPEKDYESEPVEEISPLEEITPIIQPDVEEEAMDPKKEVDIDERTEEIEGHPSPTEYGEDEVQTGELEESPDRDSGYEEQEEVPERKEKELGNDGIPS